MREIVGACPLDCPDACSWVVTVDDTGTPVKLRGNPDHPHTRGGLCVKVNPYLEHTRSPQRLLHPLRRVGPKGSDRFERVRWDEAIDLLADRLLTAIDEHGAGSIWPFDGTGNVGFLQGCGAPAALWSAIGAAHHHLGICSISGHVGIGYTAGSAAGMDPDDMADARTVIVWGSNTLTSNQHQWPAIRAARDRGAHVVVIDPVRTPTADRADQHIAPLPGTDAALALGVANAIVRAGGLDTAFLEQRTLGWGEFAAVVCEWTPERAAAVCDVPADVIRSLGERMATERPTAIKLGQGMQRHAHGGQSARVVSCLPALTGDYDRLGGGLVYSTSGAYGLDTGAVSAAHLRGNRHAPTRSMTRLAGELARREQPVAVLVVSGANPMVSNPDQRGVRSGLMRDDLFTVVFDAFMTDTAAMADLVLPSTLQTEHVEVMESFGHLVLNWNEPAAPPPGECISRTELHRRIAAALGLTDPALHRTDLEIAADLLGSQRWRDAGITVDVLRDRGFVRIPGTEPFRPFADGFPTPSGRFEFASDRAERDGHGRVPDHRGPAEAAPPGDDGFDGFALVAAASHWHLNSVFAGEPSVRAKAGGSFVSIHPADAAAGGWTEGDVVEVHNERGGFRARLRIDGRARRGLAVTTKGAWLDAAGGDGVNATVREADSDMGGGAVYHDNRVRLRATL